MVIQAGVLCEWTNDAQRFLLEHFDTIHDSPSQIYHSALPFCPSSSWLHKCYDVEFLDEVKIFKGLPTEWGTCSRTVVLEHHPLAISYWNNTVAVGTKLGSIVILNIITGSQVGVLSGHNNRVKSITFSSDGVFLVSGSDDYTLKLWDVQTGGIVKTFLGHTDYVSSVSISSDSTMVASGSWDRTIRLWNVQTGECSCVTKEQNLVEYVSFSPMPSKHLISVSGHEFQQWDINGNQIGSTCSGSYVAFSPDGAHLALCKESAVTVQSIRSRESIAEFHISYGNTKHCCFSPDGKLIAASSDNIAYVWDLSLSSPSPIEMFVGHTHEIEALAFSSPSSLISMSGDRSVKFWQIGTSMTDLVEIDSESTAHHSAQIMSVTLQTTYGITITSDSDGVVRIWDILTGHCKESFQTPLKGSHRRDVRLIDNRLTVVWYADEYFYIWDATRKKPLYTSFIITIEDLKISGDGSKFFGLSAHFLVAFSLEGKFIGRVGFNNSDPQTSLTVDGSRVWAHHLQLKWEGWDFKFPYTPYRLPDTPIRKLHPNGTMLWDTILSRIQDTTSRRVIFQLGAGLGMPADVQWNNQYLVACFRSGKVLVLDCTSILLQ
jgi:WD40 repeat protein